MTPLKLRTHVITEHEFNLVQREVSPQEPAVSRVLGPQSLIFRLKMTSKSAFTIEEFSSEAQHRYERVNNVSCTKVGLYDDYFYYLSPQDTVESLLQADDICYLVVKDIKKLGAGNKRSQTATTSSKASPKDASPVKQLTPTPTTQSQPSPKKKQKSSEGVRAPTEFTTSQASNSSNAVISTSELPDSNASPSATIGNESASSAVADQPKPKGKAAKTNDNANASSNSKDSKPESTINTSAKTKAQQKTTEMDTPQQASSKRPKSVTQKQAPQKQVPQKQAPEKQTLEKQASQKPATSQLPTDKSDQHVHVGELFGGTRAKQNNDNDSSISKSTSAKPQTDDGSKIASAEDSFNMLNTVPLPLHQHGTKHIPIPSPVRPIKPNSNLEVLENSSADENDTEDSEEDIEEASRRSQRLNRAKAVSASRVSSKSSSNPSVPSVVTPVRATRQSTQKEYPPVADHQTKMNEVKTPITKKVENKEERLYINKDDPDSAIGLSGFAALSKVRPAVHDSTRPQRYEVLDNTQSSDEDLESDDSSSDDDDEDDDDSDSDDDDSASASRAKRKRGGALSALRK